MIEGSVAAKALEPDRAVIPQVAGIVAAALVAIVAVIALQNVLLWNFFPQLPRFTTDFSAAYLRRTVDRLAATPGQTVFLGDSVLWGYRLQADQTAVARLAAEGCACLNYAFKSGSPPNYLVLAQLIAAADARPRAVVVEVNQKVLNPADASYKALVPALVAVAEPLLSAQEREALVLPPPSGNGVQRALDHALAATWLMYAMRTDIRATLYGDTEEVPVTHFTPDMLLGTFNLAPLDAGNLGVQYLVQTVQLFKRLGVSVVAFTTPTNHTLLHSIIDAGPEYAANDAFLVRTLGAAGARVLDLDRAVPANEFFDEDHLTPAGQRRLAALLRPVLP